MRRIFRLLAIVGAVAGAFWLNGAQERAKATGRPLGEIVRGDVRRFVTRRFDPLVMRLGLAGGRRSVWGVLEHVGRTSGTIHHTPVMPFLTEGRVFIPLPYGPDAEWVRNVRAAGHCRLQVHEEVYDLDEPAVIEAAENQALAGPLRRMAGRMGSLYLRLHVLEKAPATFPHEPVETTGPLPDVHGEHIMLVGHEETTEPTAPSEPTTSG